MTDNELLELLYDDKVGGITALADTYAGLIYDVAFGVLGPVGTDEDISECTADAFEAFYDNLDDVDISRASIRGYLGILVYRRAVNLYYTLSPGDEATFDEPTPEEMSNTLEDAELRESPELSDRIIALCLKKENPQTKAEVYEDAYREEPEELQEKKESPFSRTVKILFAMVALVGFIVAAVIAVDRFAVSEEKTTTVTEQPSSEKAENPLIEAIISGNEKLIEELLTNSVLLTQDVLAFAVEYADKISYDVLRHIAEQVKEKYGSTGLDPILDDALFGDFQSVLDKLKEKAEKDMSSAERLADFFAESFGEVQ